ncbi:hypothetical protein H634G_03786 [Metarhizium anisopliae BRIP 53293]|uniref:DUF4267 domain-containing protein n=1 Tax=Metarhizium anisopliae BRIP 53293 TaxID=1291518 RepID=A0A0D9P4P5_METAN|nr:hypothetical protein H634G_03786 [Metarhizium anisopliae BRIP 53293]KJK87913.1 hypothetical protein H633G_08223 [Metarhizium anisopliae BRIP 53284]
MEEASPTTPLIRREEPKPQVLPAVTRLQYIATAVIAALHIVRGIALLVCPAVALSSFAEPTSSTAFFFTSLLGVRDIILGGLLTLADPRRSYEIHRALGIALFSDSVDTFVLIFVVACSAHLKNPAPEIISVVLLAVLEHLTLWSFDEEDDDGLSPSQQATIQVTRLDDKRLRLGMWLEELKQAESLQEDLLSTPESPAS